MNWLESSHQILAVLICALWAAGFIFLILGRKAKDLDWVAVTVLGIFVIGVAVDLFFINRDMASTQKIWARGWIGPRDQNGAITIGILEDPLGLTVAIASAVIGVFLSLNRWLTQREDFPERVHAGVLMGVAGVSVAWLSLTPWLAILGMALATLGGFVLLGAKQDPEQIGQFGRERTWGFVLSFLGAAVLAGGRSALSMDKSFSLSAQPLSHSFDVIGAVLLLLGTYFYLQPFPFLNWLSRPSRVSASSSVIVCQVFSALASFGLAIRFEPELRSVGVFEIFQWLALASAILAAVSGLAQDSWKTALPLWLSAILSVAFAALCFSGPVNAFAILLGAGIAASVLSLLACAAEAGALGPSGQKWFKPLCVMAVGPAIGFFGFVSSGGISRMMAQAAQDPALAAVFGIALLITNLVLWKSVFSIFADSDARTQPAAPGTPVLPVATTCALLVLSLGLLWTGTFTGGAVPHNPDSAFSSWFATLFGSQALEWGEEPALALGEGLFWSAVVLSGLISVWLFGRGQDLVIRSLEKSPRFRNFLQTGYSLDRLAAAVLAALRVSGEFLEKWIVEKLSIQWIPAVIEKALRFPARWIDEIDRRVYAKEGSLLRQWVEVPAKALQLVQNGDLQWYLVFAIGCVVAMLIHFLRV